MNLLVQALGDIERDFPPVFDRFYGSEELRTCDACGRIEVAIADELTLGPKGVNVKGRGVLSKHEGMLALPWQKRMQAFYAALLAVSARDADG